LDPFDRYIGIPWIDRGRGIAGCDCYGLLRLVLSELRGVELPSLSDLYTSAAPENFRRIRVKPGATVAFFGRPHGGGATVWRSVLAVVIAVAALIAAPYAARFITGGLATLGIGISAATATALAGSLSHVRHAQLHPGRAEPGRAFWCHSGGAGPPQAIAVLCCQAVHRDHWRRPISAAVVLPRL
jgi:hypothetical protein